MIFDLIFLPLLIILRAVIVPFIPKASERLAYEKRSRHFKGGASFHLDQLKADLAFEFSSEGEFQQCLPLIEAALKENQLVELIYFSPSVEKGVHQLYEKHPKNIRVLNFPLLSYMPSIGASFRRWVSADKLILVRYDFLPEILLWAMSPKHELQLIWASFKKKRLKAKSLSFYQMSFLNHARKIIAATTLDAEFIKKHGIQADGIYDFRIVQILNRLDKREETLNQKFPSWNLFSEVIKSFDSQNRVLLGNAWIRDLELIPETFVRSVHKKEKLLVIVPHLVGQNYSAGWDEKLKSMGLTIYNIFPETNISQMMTEFKANPGVIVLHLKGILCELYHYFSYAYVGGGHGVSVHSILEPYASGSQYISCGPKTERSTEIDIANEKYPVVSILKNAEDFNFWVENTSSDSIHERVRTLEEKRAEFHHLRKRLEHVKESL